MTRWRRFSILLVAAAWLTGLHMVLLAGSAPVVRTIRVALPGWPAGVADRRIVFLSDIHTSMPGDTPARLARTVARIAALRPDLILIGGDCVADLWPARTYPPAVALAPLAGLHAPLGVFAVLGNHDWVDGRAPAVAQGLARLGVTVLDNQAVRFGPLALLGVADAQSQHADVPATLGDWRAKGGAPLVFTHSPDIVPSLPPDTALVLAGHTHCGQVRLPLVGALLTASRYGDRYGCGVIREGARTTIVTAGLGLSGLPLRLGLPPDLWLVTVGR